MIGSGSEGSGGGTGGVPGGGIGCGPWVCIASSLVSAASAVKANAAREQNRYARAAGAGLGKTVCCTATAAATNTGFQKSKIKLATPRLLPARQLLADYLKRLTIIGDDTTICRGTAQ